MHAAAGARARRRRLSIDVQVDHVGDELLTPARDAAAEASAKHELRGASSCGCIAWCTAGNARKERMRAHGKRRRKKITVAVESGDLTPADLVVRPAIMIDVLRRRQDAKTGPILLFVFLLYYFAFIACTYIFLSGSRDAGTVYSIHKGSSRWIANVGRAAGTTLAGIGALQDVWPWAHALVDDVYTRNVAG